MMIARAWLSCAMVSMPGVALGAAAVDVSTSDVCAVVPGADVAAAVGGRLTEAKLLRPGGTHARCVYHVSWPPAQAKGDAAFVVWLLPPEDFAGLRTYQDDPVEPVKSLGDEAFTTFHADSGRHELVVLLRGVAAIQVTGADAAETRSVAAVAVRHLLAHR